MTYYHRITDGPTPLVHSGQHVEYFTILPAGEGIEEPNVPVLMTEHDLTNEQKLRITAMVNTIEIHFDGKTYDYRTQTQKKDEDGNLVSILVETEIGF